MGQTESKLGVRSPCAPSSGSQASDSRLPLDGLVRRNPSRAHIRLLLTDIDALSLDLVGVTEVDSVKSVRGSPTAI